MKKAKQPKPIEHLVDWEWTTLVASWRYYEYRCTIASAAFPEDIISRFWASGKYAKSALDQIARQFVEIDHHDGEPDWSDSKCLMDCDKEQWCKFYAFCKAWLYGFTTLTLDNGNGLRESCDAFFCKYTKKWHPKDKYIETPHHNYWCPEEFIKENNNG